jgi:hypothetical protein
VTPKQRYTDLRFEGAHALADGRRRDPQLRCGARKIPQPHTGGKYAQRFQGRQSFRHASFEAELQMKVKNYRCAIQRLGPIMRGIEPLASWAFKLTRIMDGTLCVKAERRLPSAP